MFIKVLIISIIILAFIMLALAVKLLFDKDAEFTAHSCAAEKGDDNKQEAGCSMCQVKVLADCKEK